MYLLSSRESAMGAHSPHAARFSISVIDEARSREAGRTLHWGHTCDQGRQFFKCVLRELWQSMSGSVVGSLRQR